MALPPVKLQIWMQVILWEEPSGKNKRASKQTKGREKILSEHDAILRKLPGP